MGDVSSSAAGRPRPLSTGLWTLLTWLRRDSSTESLSSVGSDRTARSFAFLPPARYQPAPGPPPHAFHQGPPTDSYKRRLRERNLRRQQERDLTLGRKYQLPYIDNGPNYDAFSLPPARMSAHDAREKLRRAKSECAERPRVHVPGKRRAPPPPCVGASATLPRRHRPHKRRAPPPPPPPSVQEISPTPATAVFTEVLDPPQATVSNDILKSGKIKETTVKLRSEKSFIRQIFVSKKRHSSIEATHVKLLPSISELDRQAVQLLENYKQKTIERNNNAEVLENSNADGNMWICTNCLRKYNADVITCFYCIFTDNTESDKAKNNDKTSKENKQRCSLQLSSDAEDKEKLKEMLKEMKNSLRKQTNADKQHLNQPSINLETPTLPMGAKIVTKTPIEVNNLDHTDKPGPSGYIAKTNIIPIQKPFDSDKTQIKLRENLNGISKPTPVLNTPNVQTKKITSNLDTSDHIDIAVSVNPGPLKIENNSIKANTDINLLDAIPSNADGNPVSKLDANPITNKATIAPRETVNNKGKQSVSANVKAKVNNSVQTDNREGVKLNSNHYFQRRILINSLEKSIASGDETAASEAAIKLAQLRVNCSVLSFTPPTELNARIAALNEQTATKSNNKNTAEASTSRNAVIANTVINNCSNQRLGSKNVNKANNKNEQIAEDPKIASVKDNDNDIIRVQVWVEDRLAARGPALVAVRRADTLGTLRREAERELGVPTAMQRWVVRGALRQDDSIVLTDLAGPDLDAPFYLCLVELESTGKEGNAAVYEELVRLEQSPLVSNSEAFECGVCLVECDAGEGCVLRECAHAWCLACLREAALAGGGAAAAACPAPDCPAALQPRELRALLSPADLERWLARELAQAESADRHAFHCRTRDCVGWALCEPGVLLFPCPVCGENNCLPCQAIHKGETCMQYQNRLNAPTLEEAEEKTRTLLQKMLADGEALACPQCKAIITKKVGCDWVQCAACKCEICWVTRGPRWGPAGNGDTSGGCRCRFKGGVRCHPNCNFCH